MGLKYKYFEAKLFTCAVLQNWKLFSSKRKIHRAKPQFGQSPTFFILAWSPLPPPPQVYAWRARCDTRTHAFWGRLLLFCFKSRVCGCVRLSPKGISQLISSIKDEERTIAQHLKSRQSAWSEHTGQSVVNNRIILLKKGNFIHELTVKTVCTVFFVAFTLQSDGWQLVLLPAKANLFVLVECIYVIVQVAAAMAKKQL